MRQNEAGFARPQKAATRSDRQIPGAEGLARFVIDPALRNDPCVEDRRPRIVRPEFGFDSLVRAAALRAADHEQVRASQRAGRLPEPAQREHVSSGERVQAVHHHNVQVAPQAPVLKAVVQDHDVRVEAFLDGAAGGCPVRPDAHWRDARSQRRSAPRRRCALRAGKRRPRPRSASRAPCGGIRASGSPAGSRPARASRRATTRRASCRFPPC